MAETPEGVEDERMEGRKGNGYRTKRRMGQRGERIAIAVRGCEKARVASCSRSAIEFWPRLVSP